MKVDERIAQLVQYGILTDLVPKEDKRYTTNQILEVLKLDSYEEPAQVEGAPLEEILEDLLTFAYERGLMENDGVVQKDLFDTKIMNCLMPHHFGKNMSLLQQKQRTIITS